jgi:hypothetical protein
MLLKKAKHFGGEANSWACALLSYAKKRTFVEKAVSKTHAHCRKNASLKLLFFTY